MSQRDTEAARDALQARLTLGMATPRRPGGVVYAREVITTYMSALAGRGSAAHQDNEGRLAHLGGTLGGSKRLPLSEGRCGSTSPLVELQAARGMSAWPNRAPRSRSSEAPRRAGRTTANPLLVLTHIPDRLLPYGHAKGT